MNKLFVINGTIQAFNLDMWEDFISNIDNELNTCGECTLKVADNEPFLIKNLNQLYEFGEIYTISNELYSELENIFATSYGDIYYPYEIIIGEI